MKNLLVTLALLLHAGLAWADDWTRFRGPGGAGVTRVALPSDWDVETGLNVPWQVDLPGKGVSGPIVVDGRVIVTASDGLDQTRLHVLAFDSATGKQLWDRQFWATGRTNCHGTSAVAANTPTSDGEHIFALYSSNDLVSLDLDGNLRWIRALSEDHAGIGNDVGMASSPIVAGGAVVVQVECQRSAFAAAYDAKSGKQLWQVERPSSANWSTPVAVTYAESKQGVVLQSGSDLTLLDAVTGEQVWSEPIPCESIPSASYAAGLLVVPSAGLVALGNEGDERQVLWRSGTLQPGSMSPVLGPDRLYVINRAGVLNGADLATGDTLWKERLKGSFLATPLLADDKLYCINSQGDAFVVSAQDGKVLSKPKFGQDISATPAAADGGMYIRSNGKLWKIGVQSQAQLPNEPLK